MDSTRVLIVEDDEQWSALLEATLRAAAAPYTVETVPSYDRAAGVLAAAGVDVVLIDHQLLGGAGIDLVHETRRCHPRAVLIVVTGAGSPALERQAIEAGAHDYVEKDVPPAHIERTIRRALERRAAAEALEQSQRRYRMVVDEGPTILWQTDRELRIIYIRGTVLTYTPFQRQDLVGRSIGDVFGCDEAATPVREHRLAAAGAASSFEIEWYGRVWQAHVRPHHDEAGGIAGTIGLGLDVTDQRRAEAQARVMERTLAAIFDTSRDGIAICRRDGAMIHANRAAREMFGVGPGPGAAGPLDFEVVGRYVDPGARAELSAAIGHGGVRDFPVRYRHDDGHVVQCLVSASVSEPGEVTAIFRDVTDEWARQRQIERLAGEQEALRAHLEDVLASLPGMVWELVLAGPRAGFRNFASGPGREMLGCPVSEWGADGVDWRTLVHAEDEVEVAQALADAAAGREVPPVVARVRTRQHAWLWTETRLVAMRDAAGTIVGVRGVTFDISRRKALEEQLRQAQRIDAMGRLAGVVAHDFNNLLTIILGYTDILLAGDVDRRELADDVEQIRSAAESAARLTQQLLAFSRHQVIQVELVNVAAFVRGLERMLQRFVEEDVRLRTVAPASAASVKVDRGQLEQVVINLVVNARDAVAGGGAITIAVEEVALAEPLAQRRFVVPPGRYVALTVRDTGAGMSEEVQDRLFEPFFTTKPAGKGTGLGLATVHGIVQGSGGHLLVRSEVGRGTSVTVYLPALAGAAAVPPAPARRAARAAAGGCILVVEDEPAVRALVRKALERGGYTVRVANALNAPEVAREHAGELVLLLTDMVMPEISGLEVAAAIRQHLPRLPVLYMSGYTEHVVFDRFDSDRLLQKPFTPDRLLKAVREAVDAGGAG